LISFNIFPVTKIAEIDEKERKSLFNKEQIQTKTPFCYLQTQIMT